MVVAGLLGLRAIEGGEDGGQGKYRVDLDIHGSCLPGILQNGKKVTGNLDLFYL
jgi:hypothetical protein